MFNDHFDKVFCLNLPVRQERKQRMSNLFEARNMEVEFFSACRGFAIPFVHEFLKERFSAAGYVGTLISYLNLFDYALDKGYENICVIEDDVMIHKEIHSISDNYIPRLPGNSEMCYFSYIPLSDDHAMWNYNEINDKFVDGDVRGGIFKARNLCSMMGFSMKRSLMEKLVRALNQEPQPIDLYIMSKIQDKEEHGVYAINPQLFCATDCHSDGCGYVIPELMRRSVDLRASRFEDYE